MRTLLVAGVMAAALAGSGCHRAATRSFNGWWHLDESASTGVPPMMRGHDTVIHLTQSGDRFVIEFLFDGRTMNTSDFVLDGQMHSGQLGATQEARWVHRPDTLEIDIHRPAGGPMPGGNEHLVWALQPGGQEIRRTSTHPDSSAPPQVYVYRRIGKPSGAGSGQA
ncbi:MAG TPA: hypothetical protein VNE16_05600 [Vicinamibacterales bacterium]|nr:hypothetical protein [Vicinamibacterales bacterium]